MARQGIINLYYITHVDNVSSILERGILSHERIAAEEIDYKPIYDNAIVVNRHKIKTPTGRSLWGFANLYFQPRNPMLYRVLREKSPDEIVIISLKSEAILSRTDIFVSTGNAASHLSEILNASDSLEAIPEIRKAANKDWWTEESGLKRRIMAECLVPDVVSPDLIQAIYVADHNVADKLKPDIQSPNIHIIPEPKMFFEPQRKIDLIENLCLVAGDMFLSKMQTLTISVNCVGVMGKGLASRAKYQFPDVYVFYQDLCRKRTLQMGKPAVYKRELSLDYLLFDEPSTLSDANLATWFLLFPTKNHWRQNANIHGIEEGLRWLQDKCGAEGITSLAMPALGCGLGKLGWREVGPMICKYMYNLGIPAWVYLPAERKIPDEFLTKEFLLT